MKYVKALDVSFNPTLCKLGVMTKEYKRNQNKNNKSPRFKDSLLRRNTVLFPRNAIFCLMFDSSEVIIVFFYIMFR